MKVSKLMRNFKTEPRAGSRVILFLKDGKEILANCTQMVTYQGAYMQYYNAKTRKAVDPNSIQGWMPAQIAGATP